MKKQSKLDPQEALRLAAQNTFATPDGAYVLEMLKARTISRPSFPADSAGADGQAIALMMAVREGENNLYRYLESISVQKQEPQNDG